MRTRFFGCAIAFLLACTQAPIAHAANKLYLIVDAAGGQEFTSLQVAIDSLRARMVPGSTLDTIEVRAGWYDEDAVLPYNMPHGATIYAPAGMSATRLRHLAWPYFPYPHMDQGFWTVDGLGIAQLVNAGGQGQFVKWSHARFEQGYRGSAPFDVSPQPNMSDCEFQGRSLIAGFSSYSPRPPFLRLHFIGAPLEFAAGESRVELQDCTFEGPADTLVFAKPYPDGGGISFTSCRFERASYGVVAQGSRSTYIGASRSAFLDLTVAGAWLDQPLDYSPSGNYSHLGWTSSDSRYERCGTAIHWLSGRSSYCGSTRDTITDCTADGLVLSLGTSTSTPLVQSIIQRCGGNGLVVDIRRSYSGYASGVSRTSVTNSQFLDNAGDGMMVRDTTAAEVRAPATLTDCIATGNGGAGFRVAGANWVLARNVAMDNGGDGIVFTSTQPGFRDSLANNTSVHNSGAGIRLSRAAGAASAPQVVQHDLAVLNSDGGIRTPYPYKGSVAYNDAWFNYHGDFVGLPAPSDSNLSVDPQFCDLAAGDVGLQMFSPCGPGGFYGGIGARGETCPSTTAAAPSAVASRFAVRRNPARGAIEFVLPGGGTDARVEVLDLAGRRLWERSVRADGSALRWDGETASGRLPRGLYWARLTRPGETRLVRVVWLE